MSDFINNVINRHILVNQNVKPRLRARFEPQSLPSTPGTNDIPLEGPSGDVVSAAQVTKQAESNRIQFRTEQTGVLQADDQATQDMESTSNKLINEPFDVLPTASQPAYVDRSADSYDRLPRSQPIVMTTLLDDHAKNSMNPEFNTNQLRVNPDNLVTGENKMLQSAPFISEYQPQNTTKLEASAKHDADTDWGADRVHSGGLLGEQAIVPYFVKTSSEKATAPEPTAQSQQVIKVTIGRIDVRAVSPPSTTKPQNKAEPKPLLSIEDYLKQRSTRNSK